MKGGLAQRSGLVLQTTRGLRVRVGECEARESSVCEGFQWKLWEGSSFVHWKQHEEGEVKEGE